jgi:hypothetical protein
MHLSGDFWFRILGPEIAKMVQFPRKCTFLVISGSGFWGQKSPKWCSFWDHICFALDNI